MKTFWTTTILIATFVMSSVFAYAAGTINSGKPVPYLTENLASAEFIAMRIAKDTGWKEKDLLPYGWGLCKTLSQFSPTEQQVLWFGE